MKRFTALVAGLFLSVGMGGPVMADHVNGDTYFRDWGDSDAAIWNESVAHDYCISEEFWEKLTLLKANRAEAAIVEAVNRWEDGTDIDDDFSTFGGPPGCGDYDYTQFYTNAGGTDQEFCAALASNATSVIQLEDLDPLNSDQANTQQCDKDNNGKTDYFAIIIDWEVSGWTQQMQWDHTNTPTENEYDFLSLMMHEFGHAIGFDDGPTNDGHWPSSPTCPETPSGWQTMCHGFYGWFNGSNTTGIHQRNLESHDIGETNEVYPP